jgi:type I restriction enzyme, S subunit
MMDVAPQTLTENWQRPFPAQLPPLPPQWRLARLRHAFDFNKGLTITKENLQDEGVPCLNYGEVHSKYGFEVDPSRHPLKCVDKSYIKNNHASLLKRGDFVFADTSEDIEGSGNFTCYNSDEQAFAGYHTLIAKPKVPMNERFMAYLIDSRSYRTQVQTEVKGVKVFSISQAILKSTLVWFPPSNEQDAIAAFLDEKCAKINDAVKIKEDQIALLRERRQIIIQDAVTRGLNPAAPMKDSGIDWIGQIPAHWEVKRLRFLGDAVIGLTYDPKNLCGPDEGILVLRSSNLKNGQFVYGEAENVYIDMRIPKKLYVQKDDILICSRNGSRDLIGKCAIADVDDVGASFGAFTTVFRSKINPYLFQILNSDIFRQLSGSFLTATINQLTTTNLNSISVPIPPESERDEILDFLTSIKGKIETAIAIREAQIAALKEYKTSLINAAVTGKIKVI